MTYTYGWGSFRYYTREAAANPYFATAVRVRWRVYDPYTAIIYIALHYIHCYSCLFDGAGKLLRGDRGWERPETAATGVTRRPFIKCYPGCINLILTPFLLTLLPGREICYGWRLKDLSLESGYVVNAAATTAKPVDYTRKPHSF